MNATTRERELLETFVALSDTLVVDYDVVELMQLLVDRSAALFDAVSAGVLLSDADGRVEVLASTDERAKLVELMQLDEGAGPCLEALATGETVAVTDVRTVRDEWAGFRDQALSLGIHAACAVPMRLRGQTIGALNLFRARPGEFDAEDLAVVRAFADVATIGVLQQWALVESDLVRSQLSHALDSRVVIEQAKGVLAFRHGVDVDAAFALLRAQARRTRAPITEVARRVVAGDESIDAPTHA
ncbi:GAF and ANTAR domain-containing protein [Agrococcus jejuensis]|uniref:GAF domain-containing protein n=1 Tax=Agrococcus jejuensis TaxID=399736 RepID=A0A1G8CI63_9MICO|nr:GAF and ANTAR domain-containing protein [Agrococcus jejuensis]SDH45059.1 GAF domain-containing protein [Agrococcus jejuensis]